MEEVKRTKAEYRSSIRSKVMIREALLALMLEKSFEKISITDIVKRADINRGTFYAHFKNTNEVLNSISTSIVDEIALSLSSLDMKELESNPTPFLQKIVDFLEKDQEFFEKLLRTDRFAEVLDKARYSSVAYIINITEGLDEESAKFYSVVLDYCLSAVTTVLIDILMGKIPVTLEEAPQLLARILKPQVAALQNFLSKCRSNQENKG